MQCPHITLQWKATSRILSLNQSRLMMSGLLDQLESDEPKQYVVGAAGSSVQRAKRPLSRPAPPRPPSRGA